MKRIDKNARGTHKLLREICLKIKEQSVEARTFWDPGHRQKPYNKAIKVESLIITDSTWEKVLSLTVQLQ